MDLYDETGHAGDSPCFIVSDVAQTISFYRDKLGFELRFQEPARNPFFAIIGRDGAQIFVKSDADVAPLPNSRRHPFMRFDAFVYAPDPDALANEFAGQWRSIQRAAYGYTRWSARLRDLRPRWLRLILRTPKVAKSEAHSVGLTQNRGPEDVLTENRSEINAAIFLPLDSITAPLAGPAAPVIFN